MRTQQVVVRARMTYRGERLAEPELSKQWFALFFLNFVSLFVYFLQRFILNVLESRSSIRYWGYNREQSSLCPWRAYGSVRKVKVNIAHSRLTLCDPRDYTVPGILQARILDWVAFPFFTGSSLHRDQTQVSSIAGWFFTSWGIREALFMYVVFYEPIMVSHSYFKIFHIEVW